MEVTGEMIREMARDCDARKVAQARRMSGRELFFAGVELFDYACGISLAGMKARHPDWSQEELRAGLKKLVHWSEEAKR